MFTCPANSGKPLQTFSGIYFYGCLESASLPDTLAHTIIFVVDMLKNNYMTIYDYD